MAGLATVCRRPLSACGRILLFVGPLIGLVAGLFYARLMLGPIPVAFLAQPIERALNAELNDYSVGIAGAALHRSERGGIELRMRDLRVYDAQGGRIAEASWAGVEVSLASLFRFRVAPVRIDLIEPRVVVFKDEHGRYSMSVEAQDSSAAPRHGTGDAATGGGRTHAANGTSGGAPRKDAGVSTMIEGGVDVGRTIASLMEQLRQSAERGTSLEAVGLRNAVVVLDSGGKQTTWRVPSFELEFTHRQKRRSIGGRAQIVSGEEPWSAAFRIEASEKSRTITLATDITGIVPSRIADALPGFGALGVVDLPVTGRGELELSMEGETQEGRIAFDLGRGRLGEVGSVLGVDVEGGHIEARYDADGDRIELKPSSVVFAGGNVALVGEAVRNVTTRAWHARVDSTSGSISSGRAGSTAQPIRRLAVRARVGGNVQGAVVESTVLDIAGTELTMAGQVGGGVRGQDIELTGQIGAMPVAVLQALAPSGLPAVVNDLLANKLVSGKLIGRHLRIHSRAGSEVATSTAPRLNASITLEGQDLQIEAMKGLPLLELPRVLMRVEGSGIEITVPDAHMATAGGRRVTFKGGRLTTAALDGATPLAEIVARAQGPLPAFLEVLEREPLALYKSNAVPLSSIEGKVDSQIRVSLPLGASARLADARLDVRTRITDGRIKDVVGSHDISGATIAIDATERAADLKGELLVSGVVVKVAGQWQAAPPDGRQTPIKFTTRLDGAYRVQLGMDLEHMVAGEVPVEVIVQPGPGETKVAVSADLSGAEVTLGDLQWRKPAGRTAKLEFDVAKGTAPKTLELQNFRVVGDDIAIVGTVGVGPDNKAREYAFPQFSLNVVTNLSVTGKLRPDRVWEVVARGKTYDARDMFRSFYVFGGATGIVPKNRPGIDLDAEIDSVLGANDATLRRVKIRMQQRAEKMTALELTGTLDSGQTLVAMVKPDPGRPRTMQAISSDAGEAFKLIGLYTSMIGGSANLEVALDGRGTAEKSGQVRIRNFRVLGDPVVAEVLQSVDATRPAIDTEGGRARRRVVREQFDFEQMNASVSVGNGQLVLEDVIVKGPLIGASLRGKIDYRTQRMQLGGTYIPLSGINRALSDLPLLGVLLTGPRGEGIFGITFAVDGPVAQPNVIVNPLSLVTPGVFREIFQMLPESPRITPKAEPKPTKGSGPQIRASPPLGARDSGGRGVAERDRVDGWSATTEQSSGNGR